MPFFSIVVCIYNSEKYLKNCLDSIIIQDFKDWELILIDDGSFDRSSAIMENYRNDNVVIVHKENEGLSLSRNLGVKLAKGKYIWFVDSDDEIEEDALSTMYEALSQSDADLLRINYRRISQNSRTPEVLYRSNIYSGNLLNEFKHLAVKESCARLFTCWMHIYKKEIIENIPFISEKEIGFEDICFNCLVYQRVKSVQIINGIFYRYYDREGSLIHQKRNHLKMCLQVYKKIKEKYIEMNIFEEYLQDLASSFLNHAFLGDGIPNNGTFVSVYLTNDFLCARETVEEVLNDGDFKEMLQYGKDEKADKTVKEEYVYLENGDEKGLRHYLRDLSLEDKGGQ